MIIGKLVGQPTRRSGAVPAPTGAVHRRRALLHTIAVLDIRTGRWAGLIQRSTGAVPTITEPVIHMTAAKAFRTGSTAGRWRRRHGAAIRRVADAQLLLHPTIVLQATPIGKQDGRVQRRIGAAIMSGKAVWKLHPCRTTVMLALAIGKRDGRIRRRSGVAPMQIVDAQSHCPTIVMRVTAIGKQDGRGQRRRGAAIMRREDAHPQRYHRSAAKPCAACMVRVQAAMTVSSMWPHTSLRTKPTLVDRPTAKFRLNVTSVVAAQSKNLNVMLLEEVRQASRTTAWPAWGTSSLDGLRRRRNIAANKKERAAKVQLHLRLLLDLA
mmetsp:Transcript_37454/g.67715  ORF Transcript_37454/g.67715 Transcript_37454/m.67715 type:complete len:323 (-) Transcript_37454:435-1403(-)